MSFSWERSQKKYIFKSFLIKKKIVVSQNFSCKRKINFLRSITTISKLNLQDVEFVIYSWPTTRSEENQGLEYHVLLSLAVLTNQSPRCIKTTVFLKKQGTRRQDRVRQSSTTALVCFQKFYIDFWVYYRKGWIY